MDFSGRRRGLRVVLERTTATMETNEDVVGGTFSTCLRISFASMIEGQNVESMDLESEAEEVMCRSDIESDSEF